MDIVGAIRHSLIFKKTYENEDEITLKVKDNKVIISDKNRINTLILGSINIFTDYTWKEKEEV